MEKDWSLPGVSKSDIGPADEPEAQRAPLTGRRAILIGVVVVAVAAVAATAWIYADTRRELVRLATDVAQIRVSLDLYGRQAGTAAAVAASASPSDEILELKNRLAILEQAWRGQSAAGASLPALSGQTPAAPATATSGPLTDCIPPSTRFLVTNGDSYPICGTKGVVDVALVDTGNVSFGDGTIIPAGGNAILKGTSCTLAVISAGADGMTGYAELRASC